MFRVPGVPGLFATRAEAEAAVKARKAPAPKAAEVDPPVAEVEAAKPSLPEEKKAESSGPPKSKSAKAPTALEEE